MKKFHIQVYKVSAKAEIDIIAEDKAVAKSKALLSKLNFIKPDCKFIAVDVEEKK